MSTDSNRIKSELQAVGIYIDDIYDLVNSSKPYPQAIPVLLDMLQRDIHDIRNREGVVRALAVKEARGKVCAALVAEYNNTPKDQMSYRWAIGNTISVTMTKEYIEDVLSIVKEKANGTSRQMFVLALGKIRAHASETVLIDLVDDSDVAAHAINSLGKLRSKLATEKITSLIGHNNSLIRKEARKALDRIGKSADN